MKTCTWMGCVYGPTHPQVAKDGEVWANLCSIHNAEMEKVMANAKPGTVLRTWILAQGGSRAASERMLGK